MKGINLGRVIIGGLLAGLVINISEYLLNDVVAKADMEAAMKALGKSVPMDGKTVAVWVILGFAIGIIAVWLYAAIRPRFGPGVGTAARAGLVIWLVGSAMFTVIVVNMGIFPFMALPLVWELVQSVLATIAGAWLYKEGGAAA